MKPGHKIIPLQADRLGICHETKFGREVLPSLISQPIQDEEVLSNDRFPILIVFQSTVS